MSKTEVHVQKETNSYTNRRTCIQFDTHVSKDPYTYERDINVQKETYYMSLNATYMYDNQPTHMKRDIHVQKETYMSLNATYMYRVAKTHRFP